MGTPHTQLTLSCAFERRTSKAGWCCSLLRLLFPSQPARMLSPMFLFLLLYILFILFNILFHSVIDRARSREQRQRRCAALQMRRENESLQRRCSCFVRWTASATAQARALRAGGTASLLQNDVLGSGTTPTELNSANFRTSALAVSIAFILTAFPCSDEPQNYIT